MVKRYSDIYRVQMPNIAPHVCRHTYCSNMAKAFFFSSYARKHDKILLGKDSQSIKNVFLPEKYEITMIQKIFKIDEKLTVEIFNEIVRKDLVETANKFRHQISKEINFEKKYEWLYFYLDNKRQ